MKPAFVNANVIPIDPACPRAEAFLVEDGRFVQVGSGAEITAAAGDAQVVDLAGQLLGMAETLDTGKVEAMAGILVKLLEADRAGPGWPSLDAALAGIRAAGAPEPVPGGQRERPTEAAERGKDEAQDQYQGRDGPE